MEKHCEAAAGGVEAAAAMSKRSWLGWLGWLGWLVGFGWLIKLLGWLVG